MLRCDPQSDSTLEYYGLSCDDFTWRQRTAVTLLELVVSRAKAMGTCLYTWRIHRIEYCVSKVFGSRVKYRSVRVSLCERDTQVMCTIRHYESKTMTELVCAREAGRLFGMSPCRVDPPRNVASSPPLPSLSLSLNHRAVNCHCGST